MYPAVEIVTALVFVITYLTYGLTLLSLVRVVFACALIVLFVTDLQHKILPNIDHAAGHRAWGSSAASSCRPGG